MLGAWLIRPRRGTSGIIDIRGEKKLVAHRFRLERLLGRGGMGEVWAATNVNTGAEVALKLMSSLHHPVGRRRFLAEARVANAVQHPNVIRIHDAFPIEDDRLVLVMDLLRGRSLAELLEVEAPLSFERCAALMAPVCRGVMALHEAGIVHRDLKPQNLFIAVSDGVPIPTVLDFGIAKLTDKPGITETGATLGTPCYMAPEQAFGDKSLDHRADVFSLGAVFYECLTGMRPIEADGLGQYVKSLMTTAIMPLEESAPDVPSAVAGLVMRMLARDAAERPTLTEVVALLETPAHALVVPKPASTLDDAPPSTLAVPLNEPRGLWGLIAVAALSVVAGGWWLATQPNDVADATTSASVPTEAPVAPAAAPPPHESPATPPKEATGAPVSTEPGDDALPRHTNAAPRRPAAPIAQPAPSTVSTTPPAASTAPPLPARDEPGLETDYANTK